MAHCLCTLREMPEEGYSRAAERLLTGTRRIRPQLEFNRADVAAFREVAAENMSMSGVQEKISLTLRRGKLHPSERDGEYLLKPRPSGQIPAFIEDVPANEHLTMQLASQVFKLKTAANACIRFADGELAYITRRFDRQGDARIAQEDFCQLLNRTEETNGRNYKYSGSYEEAGRLLRQYCAAHIVEIEKLFQMIAFNYVFSNGDAHLKNFSLRETQFGDYILTPAYDLICTSLHFPNESRTALELFDNFETDFHRANGFYGRPDFLALADRYEIKPRRAEGFLDSLFSKESDVLHLVERSFLSAEAKADYTRRYQDRCRAML